MKTTFITLLILLLTVSVGHAQSNKTEDVVVEVSKTISVENNKKQAATTTVETKTIIKDSAEVEAILAKSTSDIRSYLNRERQVSNIGLLFPSLAKRVKA
ncbi:hypothetical protein ACFFU1_15520 [Algibacter miyuki]|uniref:TonB-dependent receptor n=1 Tax=Algibacter miyuki TaxID=1306933 RepID=A0ABV5H3N2_9FLAO|nr:hypothetical protein [Algibacter miyuki]MDN3665382.1 hypothetical protein [Algibacter miyuki]